MVHLLLVAQETQPLVCGQPMLEFYANKQCTLAITLAL